ncbi:hypothetical protein GCM10025867_33300 [Frondihabitans sucicola]|uniref:Uncharacterized protein n=1 Tax=Frondihabitans sucicola TaxID=1268041 RepID=A0ABM8GS38_9MICO|nr:hypothetical protein GCM10025867_33300 [Frondihabitans sucicola]
MAFETTPRAPVTDDPAAFVTSVVTRVAGVVTAVTTLPTGWARPVLDGVCWGAATVAEAGERPAWRQAPQGAPRAPRGEKRAPQEGWPRELPARREPPDGGPERVLRAEPT